MRHKKKAAMLALLTAGGGAAAQSSVTLFGLLDVGVSHYSATSSFYSNSLLTPPPATGTSARRSQTVLSTGGNLPSRLGFRGTEDLGGGLAASFWLEMPLTVDDGATPLTFARRSTVSFTGPFGEIRLGRDYTTIFWADTLFDPFNNSGVGANLVGSVNNRLASIAALSGGAPLGGGLPGGPDGYVRTSNSIGYLLPSQLGGIYGHVQYAFHENVKATTVPESPSRRGAVMGARLGYASGPLDVAVAYSQTTMVDAVSAAGVQTERKIKTANIGGTYDFGRAKLHAELSRAKDEASVGSILPLATVVPGATSDKYDGVLLGVSVPIGPGSVLASYSRVKFKDDPGTVAAVAFTPNLQTSANKIALGYTHNLSKRTLLYATIARIRIKDGQNNLTVMGTTTSNAFSYLATGTTSGFKPSSSSGYDFGIRHVF